MMKKAILSVVILLAMTWLLAQNKKDDALDPLKVAPDTHKLALDNKFVRILDVRLSPGKVEPLHRHPHGLSVYFTDWDAKVTVQGGKPETRHRQAGTFAWSEALVHEVQNVGKTEGHILRV